MLYFGVITFFLNQYIKPVILQILKNFQNISILYLNSFNIEFFSSIKIFFFQKNAFHKYNNNQSFNNNLKYFKYLNKGLIISFI